MRTCILEYCCYYCYLHSSRMMRIVGDSRRFVAVDTAVFAVVAATVVDTVVDTAADTPAVFAATVADTVVVVVAVAANHSKNYKTAQKSDRETHNLHDWFRTTQYAC